MRAKRPGGLLGKTRKQRIKFQPEDDEKLRILVAELGTSNWPAVAREMRTRDARQCRDRWQNYLCPNIVNGPWTDAEDELLYKEYHAHGSAWRVIARAFPTRTDVSIKNRWRQLERRSKRKKRSVAVLSTQPPKPPEPASMIQISQQELDDILAPLDDLQCLFDSDLMDEPPSESKTTTSCKNSQNYEKFNLKN